MATTKQVQVYNFETVQSRFIKEYLNKRSVEGEKLFAVYPSGLVSGVRCPYLSQQASPSQGNFRSGWPRLRLKFKMRS